MKKYNLGPGLIIDERRVKELKIPQKFHYSLQVHRIKFDQQKFIIKLIDWNYAEYELFFYLKNENLIAESEVKPRRNSLYPDILMDFLKHISNNSPNLFTILDPNEFDEKIKKVAEMYGISAETVFKYSEFKHDYSGKLKLFIENGYEWVFNNDQVKTSEDREEQEKEKIKTLKQVHNNAPLELGVILSEYSDFNKLSISVMRGKPQKSNPLLLTKAKKLNLREIANNTIKYPFLAKFSSLQAETQTYAFDYDITAEVMRPGHLPHLHLFLESLKGFERVFWNKSFNTTSFKNMEHIQISEKRFNLKLSLVEINGNFKLEIKRLLQGKRESSISTNTWELLDLVIYKNAGTIYLVDDVEKSLLLFDNFDKNNNEAPIDLLPTFLNNVANKYLQQHEIEMSDSLKKKIGIKQLSGMIKKLYISELDKFILFTPICSYDKDQDFNPLETNKIAELSNENKVLMIQRDTDQEKTFLDTLRQKHEKFERQGEQGFFSLKAEDFVKDYWFLGFSDQLQEEGIELYGIKELKNIKYSLSRPSVNFSIDSGIDWFEANATITIGDETIDLKSLKKKLVKNTNYIKLSDGKLAILPQKWYEKLTRYLRLGEVNKDGTVHISKNRFNVLDEDIEFVTPKMIREVQEKKKKLAEFTTISKKLLPDNITAVLRHYQEDGFNWLCFLEEYNWGGILADDMGLGKTLQMLTYIQYKINQGIDHPILVVVPTSLLFNWANEINKFAPHITHVLHHGSNRKPLSILSKEYDLIITTYGIVTLEITDFEKQQFELIVLDESQNIKNIASQRYKACMKLKAKQKLTLTGTPIENNTFDLYAQLNFTNPGLLGTIARFKEDYAYAIDRDRNEGVASELQKMVNPFMLRRTKEQVAKELPDKTEDIIYCVMDKAQRKVYDAFRNEYRKSLLAEIEEEGMAGKTLQFLQALTKLRQICDSPQLLPDGNYTEESAKIDILISNLNEKIGNHKVLVFSQFVSMLLLIKDKLDVENIAYEYLDGSTTQKAREKAVANFQENDHVRVFLISLKAGGTGLNLTSADYVYIMDPWWNPAVENQAIDRCYRIGQTNHVIAYRMICKDTVEEKIMDLKSKKLSISDAIITTDENMLKKLTPEDLKEMF